MTPQQLKALKLALEALELINIEFICRNGSHHKKEDRHEWDEDCPITNRWRTAITALEEVLKEHAMRETQRLGQEIEQEPVAYYLPHKGFYWAKPTSISAPTIADVEPLPLYTHPPKENT